MYAQWIDSLSKSPLFRGIEGNELNTMLNCLRPARKEYRAREIIALNGGSFSGIGTVITGKISLTRETYSGNRIILSVLGPGEVFGEIVAFSSQSKWPVTVVAMEDCRLIFLPPAKILGNCSNICRAHSSLIMNMLNIVSNRALVLNQKMEHLSARSIRGKIASYFLEQYRENEGAVFKIPLSRTDLADYLAIPRPSLSRELGNMRQDGILEIKGSSVNIKDVIKLENSIR